MTELVSNLARNGGNQVGVINRVIQALVVKDGQSKCSAFRSCADLHSVEKVSKKVFVDPSASAGGINAYRSYCDQTRESCTDLIKSEVVFYKNKSLDLTGNFHKRDRMRAFSAQNYQFRYKLISGYTRLTSNSTVETIDLLRNTDSPCI